MVEYKIYYISQEGLLKEPLYSDGYTMFDRFTTQEEAEEEIEELCYRSHEFNSLQFVILPVPR